ncbi:hypothetical protein ACSSZE_17315 [Acidithiobacillus caldus]
MAGFLTGFLAGEASAPVSADYSRAMVEWKKRAIQEMEMNQKLSKQLEIEHRKFLIERRERRAYLRSWKARGDILREECGYTTEQINEKQGNYVERYDEKYEEAVRKSDREIEAEALNI